MSKVAEKTVSSKRPRTGPPRRAPAKIQFNLIIGGRIRSSVERYPVFNPANGEPFAESPLCSMDQLDEAVELARLAQKTWRRCEDSRQVGLRRCSQVIRQHRDELAEIVTLEQGKPISQSRSEVSYAASQFEEASTASVESVVLAESERLRTVLHYQPLGVVGLITPWNFPVGTAAVKLAPALRMGNTVVLKPSPTAPLSALRLGELLSRVLPTGVISVLSGHDDLGDQLAKHSAVSKISLTGAMDTGKAVMASGAANLKRLTLELGGNDAAIVLADANPKAIVGPIIAAAFRNAGQVCSAIKRVYVPTSLEEDLVDLMKATIQKFVIGPGIDPVTTMGPLTTLEQQQRVLAMVLEAGIRGGVEHAGGQSLPDSGYFLAPTLVTGVGRGCRLVDDEQFGPVLPIIAYEEVDDAIEQANASPFGLSASVWTSDEARGYEIASQLEAGRVGVNGHSRAETPAPFGGFKQSGLGRELSTWGLLGMSELQVVNVFRESPGL